jgi:(4S)-4-hydroxy-5-phosphonooxypentane-2,3-dione isomerase
MIVTCIYVSVKPDAVQAFVEATSENHRISVLEAGNLRFDVLQKADDPCRFMIYEAYESEEAVHLHKQTPHYIKWRDKVTDYMDEPRQGVRYNIIEPSARSRW